MTGTELLASANSFGDVNINADTGLLWLDQIIKDLAPKYGNVTTLEYASVEADTPEDLPSAFGTLVEWIVDDEEYQYANKIIIRDNNKIYFPYDVDSIYLLYRAIPDFTTAGDEVPLNPMVHTSIIPWLVAMYWDQEGEGDTEESIQMAERWFTKHEVALLRAEDLILNRTNAGVSETEDEMPSRGRDMHTSWGDDDFYE